MPEPSDSLHELYEAELRVQVHPARGMNVLTGEARAVRRKAMARAGLAGVAGAVVVGALVLGGIHAFGDPTGPAATPSASPSPTTVAVTWNPAAAAAAAQEGFTLPACGDEFAPDPQTVANVSVTAEADYTDMLNPGEGQLLIDAAFASTDGERTSFLATGYGYVVTRDGIVVAAEAPDSDDLELYGTGGRTGNSAAAFGRWNCAATAAVAEVYEKWGWDPATDTTETTDLTKDELDHMGQEANAIRDSFAKWPAGDYQVYVVTPVLFGEQLATAQLLKDEGLATVAGIRNDLSNELFVYDDRVAPYCNQDGDQFSCNPPQDVIDEVLTFAVDPATVDTTPDGVAISAPVTVTVP